MENVHLYFHNASWVKYRGERLQYQETLLVENLREVSARGQRQVYDYFQSFDMKLHEDAVPEDLLLSCKQAHSKYEKAREKINKED